MLLSGVPPFCGSTQAAILESLMTARLHFPYRAWKTVSAEAKELVGRMLTRSVARRPDAEELVAALKAVDAARQAPQENPARDQARVVASDSEEDACGSDGAALLSAQQVFSTRSRLEKQARPLIARHVDEASISGLREMFKALDKNSTGVITLEDFRAGLAAAGVHGSNGVDELFRHVDTDGSRQIDYTEFLAVALSDLHLQREELCWEAFRIIDKDGDGQIGTRDLRSALSHDDAPMGRLSTLDAKDMLRAADVDGDGVVTFQDFVRMVNGRPIERASH
mmetsp:Transcript_16207/g.46345  ORF Transcript_16207/g.46345 Transcript_16207/m.46345 type:complete len:281 (+) Transcript_16207:741-1583(+)